MKTQTILETALSPTQWQLQRDAQIETFAAKLGLTDGAKLLIFPKYIQIETTSLCNARCIMCPITEWSREVDLMPPALFDKIVAELKPQAHWVEKVTMQSEGEPLMDKGLEDKILGMKQIGIKQVAITTNASLMIRKRAESIIHSGVDEVTFSIDGTTKATFESIRHQLNFERCVQNALNFIALRDRLNPSLRIRLRMILQEANAHEYTDFVTFWQAHLGPLDAVYARRLHHWANWMPDYILPQVQDSETLNQRLCTSLWSSLVIMTDGRVPLCCCDFNASQMLGNIREATLQDVWQSQLLSRLRQAHREQGRQGLAMCNNCNIWEPSSVVDSPHQQRNSDPASLIQ